MRYLSPDDIQRLEKEIYDQKQLIEISRALNSTLDYDRLIEAVLDMCMGHAQTLCAGIFLAPDIDAENLLLVEESKGFELTKEREYYKISLDSPIIEYFENKHHSLTLNELETCIDFDSPEAVQILREIGTELVVPMKIKGKVTGLLILGEKMVGDIYTDIERHFLSDLASLGGIAVENARLYERATVDMMTGLKNHAYFQSRTKEEREKAMRRNISLSLMLTDIDNFKNFNDAYGHQAGDEILKVVAQLMIDNSRKSDFAARYGGEEFSLVMPNTGFKRALAFAERIRKLVEKTSIDHNGNELKVTISIGVAVLDPGIDKTNKTLIERADRALYACKKAGKNQVQGYSEDMNLTDNKGNGI